MHSLAISIPSQILNTGTPTLGSLDLANLINKFKKLRWKLNHQGYLAGSSEQRIFAVYLVKEKTIFVNEQALPLVPRDFLSVIALHEALGATGYFDENYEISLALYFASPQAEKFFGRKLTHEISQALSHSPPSIQKRSGEALYAHASGGGSSVGGGGDGTALFIKITILAYARYWLEENHKLGRNLDLSFSELARRIVQSRFEMSYGALPEALYIFEDRAGESRLVRVSAIEWMGMNLRRDPLEFADLFSRIVSGISSKRTLP